MNGDELSNEVVGEAKKGMVFVLNKAGGEITRQIIKALNEPQKSIKYGYTSMNSLAKNNAALSNLELSKPPKDFEKFAKKYAVQYTFMKSPESEKTIVFFKTNDVERVKIAFSEYARFQAVRKPSVFKQMEKARSAVKKMRQLTPNLSVSKGIVR